MSAVRSLAYHTALEAHELQAVLLAVSARLRLHEDALRAATHPVERRKALARVEQYRALLRKLSATFRD